MTIQELIELIQDIIKLLRHRPPLRAATDLTAVKGTTMGSINLKWTEATTRVDGTPGVVAETFIYDERTPATPLASVLGGVLTFDVTGYAPGDYSFGIEFADSDNLHSARSNIATVTVPAATSPLVAASDLTATFVP